MLWLVRFVINLGLRILPALLAALTGAGTVLLLQLRQQQQGWGLEPADVAKTLAGDDLVVAPNIVDTRSLLIEAPPSAVWPWLAQLGYGRGGWYSYDRLDMKGRSADRILPEFGDLAAGDLVPTHPEGGFIARIVAPDEALVLYLDDDLARSQAEAARAERGELPGATDEQLTGGLQFAGAMGGLTMPQFKVSWAFVLEPEASGSQTRLIERFRVQATDDGLPARLGMPVMGLGVFAMTRKHMLGLKERAERYASQRATKS